MILINETFMFLINYKFIINYSVKLKQFSVYRLTSIIIKLNNFYKYYYFLFIEY